MKIFLKTVVVLFVFLGANKLFAFGGLKLINTQIIDMDSVETVNIIYSSTNIVLLESNDNNLILKEFMTRNSHFANIEKSHGVLTISKKIRPLFIITRTEIHIPKMFAGNLLVNLKSGNLTSNYNMNHRSIKLSVSSGNMNVSSVSSENIMVNVSSGNIKIYNCQGNVNVVNKSGNITIDNFSGDGMFEKKSGNISLNINDINGDLFLSTKSGIINLKVSDNISFIFDADVRSGNIRIPNMRTQVNTKTQHIIGSDPIYTIFAKIGSGNINIK